MGYRLKGFFYGVAILIISTLVLAPMVLMTQGEAVYCDYFCSVKSFIGYYFSPFAFLFFILNWYLGIKIAKLSYLVSGKKKEFDIESKNYTWLWEHKLRTIED